MTNTPKTSDGLKKTDILKSFLKSFLDSLQSTELNVLKNNSHLKSQLEHIIASSSEHEGNTIRAALSTVASVNYAKKLIGKRVYSHGQSSGVIVQSMNIDMTNGVMVSGQMADKKQAGVIEVAISDITKIEVMG